MKGAVGFTLDQCDIHGSALGGIVVPGGAQAPAISDAGSPIVIRDTHVYDAGRAGMVLNGDGQIDMIIEGSYFHDNGYAGILLNDFGSLTIDNSEIYNNGTSSIKTAGIYLQDVSSVIITRSQIHDNPMAGIAIEGTSNVTIGADLAEADPFSYGNDIYGNTRAGVQIGGELSTALNGNLVIRGNHLHNNGSGSLGGGIWMRAAVLSATISQNDIAQNRLGGIAVRAVHPSVPSSLVIAKNNIHDNILRGGIHTGDTAGNFANPGNFTADSTIKQNKVHHNSNVTYGGGIDVRHFRGTVKNNLVYGNSRGGIRFGDYVTEISHNTVANNGNATNDRGGGIIYDDLAGALNDPPGGGPSSLFPIKNNISAFNQRAGIRACFYTTDLYRDYNLLYSNNQDFLSGYCGPCASPDCSTGDRRDIKKCMGAQLGRGCDGIAAFCCSAPGATGPLPGETLILADPLFQDMANDDYHLQGGSGATGPLPGETLILADPLFQDMANDDYHLQGGSPAIGSGELGVDMGAYGGSEPFDDNAFPTAYVDCLIDGDTNTGNTLSIGRFLYFDLGSTYTVRHVRLYGSPTSY
ncbi:MAG: right-handed parallel beta-helix repeat-containing protein, partial [Deltaproteobacteria bacterium]|nr:right-handed parallel beta-helix repeat-containing protein [Deltaproteobacteria bacterium]